MRARQFIWTIAVLLSRFYLLFVGTLVSMCGSGIVIVGIAGRSLGWLAAGAAIMLLGWWLSEHFYSRRTMSRVKGGKEADG